MYILTNHDYIQRQILFLHILEHSRDIPISTGSGSEVIRNVSLHDFLTKFKYGIDCMIKRLVETYFMTN